MPDVVARVKQTLGRSEIEKVSQWARPPHTVEVGSAGLAYDGGSEDEDEDADARLERQHIEAWFMQRAILLRYHRNLDNVQGEGWLAAMVPLAIGSGLVAAGVGPTRLEAARDARARRIVNEGGTAWVREGGTDVPVDEPAVRRLDVPEAVRERAERLGSILRATRLLRGRTTMVDEPRDPFGMNVFQDAELLWRQLVAIEDWDEWVRAIRALSETDLRKIVFLHVHWHYKKQRREDEAA